MHDLKVVKQEGTEKWWNKKGLRLFCGKQGEIRNHLC